MKKLKSFFENLEINVIAFMLPAMCCVVLVATFARFTKLFATPWAEELSRYMFVWIVFLGVVIGVKRDAHYRVGVVVDNLSPRAQRALFWLKTVVCLVFYAVVSYKCYQVMQVQIRMGQSSPSLRIPIYLAYAAIPTGLVLSFIWTVINLFRRRQPGAERSEDNAD